MPLYVLYLSVETIYLDISLQARSCILQTKIIACSKTIVGERVHLVLVDLDWVDKMDQVIFLDCDKTKSNTDAS